MTVVLSLSICTSDQFMDAPGYFESVSEAMSITSSANCSAYDITIGGNRGHASIRSQASSRIFIGKVTESSNGYTLRKGEGESTLMEYKTNVGQYHACGVSKQSMGAVIWNVRWEMILALNHMLHSHVQH